MVHARTLHTDIGGDFPKTKTVVARCPNSPLGSIHDLGRLLWNLCGYRSHRVLWKKSLALTKPALAAAVARRYSDRFEAALYRQALRRRGIRMICPERKDARKARLAKGARGGRPRPAIHRHTRDAT
jgi:hypothetical protein